MGVSIKPNTVGTAPLRQNARLTSRILPKPPLNHDEGDEREGEHHEQGDDASTIPSLTRAAVLKARRSAVIMIKRNRRIMSTNLEGDETARDGAHEQRETERIKAPEEPPGTLRLEGIAASIETQEKEKNDRSHGATKLHE